MTFVKKSIEFQNFVLILEVMPSEFPHRVSRKELYSDTFDREVERRFLTYLAVPRTSGSIALPVVAQDNAVRPSNTFDRAHLVPAPACNTTLLKAGVLYT